jgi:hypothetical protein
LFRDVSGLEAPPRIRWMTRGEARRRGTAPFGNLVGSRMRMRAACSITRSPILIRHSRMVANSAWLPAHQALNCRGGQ